MMALPIPPMVMEETGTTRPMRFSDSSTSSSGSMLAKPAEISMIMEDIMKEGKRFEIKMRERAILDIAENRHKIVALKRQCNAATDELPYLPLTKIRTTKALSMGKADPLPIATTYTTVSQNYPKEDGQMRHLPYFGDDFKLDELLYSTEAAASEESEVDDERSENIIHAIVNKYGEREAAITALSNTLDKSSNTIRKCVKELAGKTKNKEEAEYEKLRVTGLDTSVENPLNAYQRMFCRRCFVYHCRAHRHPHPRKCSLPDITYNWESSPAEKTPGGTLEVNLPPNETNSSQLTPAHATTPRVGDPPCSSYCFLTVGAVSSKRDLLAQINRKGTLGGNTCSNRGDRRMIKAPPSLRVWKRNSKEKLKLQRSRSMKVKTSAQGKARPIFMKKRIHEVKAEEQGTRSNFRISLPAFVVTCPERSIHKLSSKFLPTPEQQSVKNFKDTQIGQEGYVKEIGAPPAMTLMSFLKNVKKEMKFGRDYVEGSVDNYPVVPDIHEPDDVYNHQNVTLKDVKEGADHVNSMESLFRPDMRTSKMNSNSVNACQAGVSIESSQRLLERRNAINEKRYDWTLEEKRMVSICSHVCGANPCKIASLLGTRTCRQVWEFIQDHPIKSVDSAVAALHQTVENNKNSDSSLNGNDHNRKRRQKKSKKRTLSQTKRKRKTVGERVIRMMNVANGGDLSDGLPRAFQPCNHPGPCTSANATECSCVRNGTFCEKYCGCSDQCSFRFPGCQCSGGCSTRACPCFAASRECDPDLCQSCEAHKPFLRDPPLNFRRCTNIMLRLRKSKHLLLGRSKVHGWGCFVSQPVKKNELVCEYLGEVVSQDEADRRGKIYDKLSCSYLFNLNKDLVVDAARKGNKIKFANHSKNNPNCYPRVINVSGDHHIGIYAKTQLKAGVELFFDYKHDFCSTLPEWYAGEEDSGKSMKSFVAKKGAPSSHRASRPTTSYSTTNSKKCSSDVIGRKTYIRSGTKSKRRRKFERIPSATTGSSIPAETFPKAIATSTNNYLFLSNFRSRQPSYEIPGGREIIEIDD